MNELNKIPILVIRFANEITPTELPFFRGAIISKVPAELTLFHNHTETGLRYRYPLIQYKRIQGNAAIVCIGEGTEAIGKFFSSADFALQIGNRHAHFEIDSVQAHQWLLQPWEGLFRYTIHHWLPFNSANYTTYNQLEGVVEKTQMLERLLIGNILSLCTGFGIHLTKEVQCKVVKILSESVYKNKGILMQGFTIEFSTNISLHNFIGLGKGVSLGFGVIKQINNKSI